MKTEEIRELVRRWEDLEARGIFEKGRTKELIKKYLFRIADSGPKKELSFNISEADTPDTSNTYEFVDFYEKHTFETRESFVSFMGKMGYEYLGDRKPHPQRRKELEGKPTFDKAMGPFFDNGKTFRYETHGLHNLLSDYDNEDQP